MIRHNMNRQMVNHYSWGIALTSLLMTACSQDKDVFSQGNIQDAEYAESFKQMIGGDIDKNQTWVTGTVINAQITTSGPATVSAYTLGKENRVLYARQKIDGSGTFKFAVPQNLDSRIAFEADYGDAEKVWRKMDLSLTLNQSVVLDMRRGPVSRAASMSGSNSVASPAESLCGNSNPSTEGSYAGHHFGYTTFPGWSWDNLALAVPEAKNPSANGQITNYELISTGPFYLSLLYGYTGSYLSCILGYYYYKEQGKYDDLVMVDLCDVLQHDYIDGYAKVQYQLDNETAWHDANFDYRDGFTAPFTTQTKRLNDDNYNTLLVNQKYNGVAGIQGIRGLTFQINVPVGYRLGFYLKTRNAIAAQVENLRELGVDEKYLNSGKGLCFSGAELNAKTKFAFRSVIQKYDGYTFMGLDDTPNGGDYDCNDVTFGLTAGNGGSLPGVLLPGVQDLDSKKYYNNDGTITDEPKDSYVQNVIEGRDPFDFGTTPEPGQPDTEPGEGGLPGVFDLPGWTIAYEDMGTIGDFDFNDVVIKVIPNTAKKARIYLCANGGTIDAEFHYDGPGGDVNFGNIHKYMASMTNTQEKLTTPAVLLGEVEWPDGYTIPTDAHRFYILVEGKKICVSTEAGIIPKAICVQGDWAWPREKTSLATAYSTLTRWATNLNDAEARDWYHHPDKTQTVDLGEQE